HKHTPQMLRRLAKDLPVVLFVARGQKGDYIAFGYTNGTWFQLLGHKDGEAVRWAFTHAEPYLRRTFKGTTAELRRGLEGAQKGKKPPAPDPKAEPGLGPEVESRVPAPAPRVPKTPPGALIPPPLPGFRNPSEMLGIELGIEPRVESSEPGAGGAWAPG